MKPGPSPKPTLLKKLAGNPGHQKLNEREPRYAPGPVTCPAFLDKGARREFRRMMRIAPDKLITPADRGVLAAMCQLYSRATEAERRIQVDGAVIETTNGNVIQSPWVGMANKAWSEYARLAMEFGLTPSSRSRIALPQETGKKSLKDMLAAGDVTFAEVPEDYDRAG